MIKRIFLSKVHTAPFLTYGYYESPELHMHEDSEMLDCKRLFKESNRFNIEKSKSRYKATQDGCTSFYWLSAKQPAQAPTESKYPIGQANTDTKL